MDRHQQLTKYVTKDKLGIEVGPWFNPMAAKREGYNCLTLDFFDTETLRERALADRFVPREKIQEIEDVDLIGSSTEIADLAKRKGILGRVDYIISSHNFEHLPNPIRFLQGCDETLKPGGVLSMAVPDRRTCFDYFRPHTTLAQWLDAYFAGRERPTFPQIFEQNSLDSKYYRNGEAVLAFWLWEDPANICPEEKLEDVFDWWKRYLANPDNAYHDTHCSTFTPASFELLISDLAFLKLTRLEVLEISETNANEFYVHLQKRATDTIVDQMDRDSFYKNRRSLLQRVNSEAGANSLETFRMRSELSHAQAKVSEQQSQIEALESKLACARAKIGEQEALIQAVLTSKSWRLTAPLRALTALLR